MTPGQKAYEAYSGTGNLKCAGWEYLSGLDAQRWESAAAAVLDEYGSGAAPVVAPTSSEPEMGSVTITLKTGEIFRFEDVDNIESASNEPWTDVKNKDDCLLMRLASDAILHIAFPANKIATVTRTRL